MLARRRRAKGDRGTALIEAAIITPVFMMFLFAIFEFGFSFRDYLSVASATRDGAREASVAGNVADADYRVLRAIERGAAALPDGVIDRIVVFKATGPDDVPTAACQSGTATTNVCNVYVQEDFLRDDSQFKCDATYNPEPDPDRFWCPYSREVSVGSGLDYVGVWMQITHDYITGLFGSSVTFDDVVVLKVEPQEQ